MSISLNHSSSSSSKSYFRYYDFIATDDPNVIYNESSNEIAEKDVLKLLKEAREKAVEILSKNKKFLLRLGNHLAIHPVIFREELRKMAEEYVEDTNFKSRETYHGFKSSIKQKMAEEGMEFTEIPEEIFNRYEHGPVVNSQITTPKIVL